MTRRKATRNKGYQRYNTLCGEAVNYDDPAAFASDAVMSMLDPDDPDQVPDMERYEDFKDIWHALNDSFPDLLKRWGLTQKECSLRFCIPYRTVQGWYAGRPVSPHMRLMMAEIMRSENKRD